MTSYYVLTPPNSTDPEKDTLFIRDGFSWLALFFPLPWLLVKRLWLIAGIAVALYAVTMFLAENWGLDPLPVAFTVILSLWTALEGGHVRAHWLKRQGWTIDATIAAHDIEEAEMLYFADAPVRETTAPAAMRGTAERSTNTLALGLIGPYGGR
jgi:hypothetical protein